MSYLKVYFSEQEKAFIQQKAKEQNVAVSQFIRNQCNDILNPKYETMTSLFGEEESRKHNGEKYVKLFLSEKEHRLLYEAAQEKGWSMSKLIYERLHERDVPIEIICQTKDIFELTDMISDVYRHLIGTATGLMQRSLITEHDKERILSLGYEIRDALKDYTTQVYRNRNAIRRNVVRHLNREIDKTMQSLYQTKSED